MGPHIDVKGHLSGQHTTKCKRKSKLYNSTDIGVRLMSKSLLDPQCRVRNKCGNLIPAEAVLLIDPRAGRGLLDTEIKRPSF